MHATASARLRGRNRLRILVVDDHAVNQLIAEALLDALGHAVALAGDGAEALECCRRNPPDVVLMDVDMPVMDGLQATRLLREGQRSGLLPPFPIIAATSSHEVQRRRDCLQAGMDGYLSKPLELQTLHNEIRRVLSSLA